MRSRSLCSSSRHIRLREIGKPSGRSTVLRVAYLKFTTQELNLSLLYLLFNTSLPTYSPTSAHTLYLLVHLLFNYYSTTIYLLLHHHFTFPSPTLHLLFRFISPTLFTCAFTIVLPSALASASPSITSTTLSVFVLTFNRCSTVQP